MGTHFPKIDKFEANSLQAFSYFLLKSSRHFTLQVFRDKMGIHKNGDVFQNVLLFLSKMGSHFIKNVL